MRSLVLALAAVATLACAPAIAFAAPAAAPASAKAPSKMKACGGQWTAMSAADKGKYNERAKTMKSKKGGKLSGYNVWTGECMKKA